MRSRTPRPRSAALAAALFFIVGPHLVGCVPCETDGDCNDDAFCSIDGVCLTECVIVSDCPSMDHACSPRGKCIQALAPAVRWIAPEPGSDVGATFDVELEVLFVGSQATVRLTRDPDAPGNDCAAFLPRTRIVEGVPGEETRATIIFEDVTALGAGEFGLQARAYTRLTDGEPADERGVEAMLSGPTTTSSASGALLGVSVVHPVEGQVIYDPPISVPLEVEFTQPFDRVWAWVEPMQGPGSSRRPVALSSDHIENMRVPVARGPQLLQLEVERGADIGRCSIGLNTAPLELEEGEEPGEGDLEIALFFDGRDPGDLDLYIFSEPENDTPDSCSPHSLSGFCQDGHHTIGVRRWGEESVRLDVIEGVYGIAIAPGAIGEPLVAQIRITRGGHNVAWLGPRSILISEGNVWLAGRIYMVGGELTIEPLDEVSIGLPTTSPGAW